MGQRVAATVNRPHLHDGEDFGTRPAFERASSDHSLIRLGGSTQWKSGQTGPFFKPLEESTMKWTKPEAEIVAVTMEVTAYVATL